MNGREFDTTIHMRKELPTVKRTIEAAVFVAVLALGWRYPYLAYCLLLNVAVGLYGAFLHGGRHGCGNFCPRGAFYSILPGTGRKVPPKLLKRNTSIAVLVVLFSGLAIWMRPTTVRAWGMLLYVMIAITTAVGIVGWLVFNRYFWCSMCPMGKIYKMIRPCASGIRVSDACVKCRMCSKACPFGFYPPGDAAGGVFRDADCMLCGRCVARCPKKALALQPKKGK